MIYHKSKLPNGLACFPQIVSTIRSRLILNSFSNERYFSYFTMNLINTDFPITKFKSTDVFFGRGPSCYNQPGNKIFRSVIRPYIPNYHLKSPISLKRACIKRILEELASHDCRFLVRESEYSNDWVVASDDIVKKKIGHTLRDYRSIGMNDTLNVKSRIKPLPKQRKHAIANIDDLEYMLMHNTCHVADRQQCGSKHNNTNVMIPMKTTCMNCPLEWLNDLSLRSLTKLIDKLQVEHQYSYDTNQTFMVDLDDYEDIFLISQAYEKDDVLDRDFMVNQNWKSVLTGGSDAEFLLDMNHNDEGMLCYVTLVFNRMKRLHDS
jgi:hypothetical protein